MKNNDILAMANDLLETISLQEQQLANGCDEFSSLSACYDREGTRFENTVAAVLELKTYDRGDLAGLREKVLQLRAANERLKAAAGRRKDEIMAAMATIRRGRKGIKKYGPDENRQVCRFIHRAT